jgi:dTDP-4-dehydrorhamnose reductase
MSVYGRSKWEGEAAVRARLQNHVIVRTAWLFGAHGNSFVKTILRLSAEREELRIVSDQYGCPTWTGDLAAALAQLSKRILGSARLVPWGTYHYCGKGATSWYEFARAIVQESAVGRAGKMPAVVPIATEDYPVPAHRPAWSVLDCGKMAAVFGIESVSWRNGLAVVIGALSA